MFRSFSLVALLALTPAMSWAQRISDFFAFVSYDDPTKVTLIMTLKPSPIAGEDPNLAPFDENVHYKIKIDNTNSGRANIAFQFEFFDEVRAPLSIFSFVGAGNGIYNVIPPGISGFSSTGLGFRQHYKVTMIRNGVSRELTNTAGQPLYAVPPDVGPRTMPDYPAVAQQGIFTLGNGIRVFAGSADDPAYSSDGAFADTLNFYTGADGGLLSPADNVSNSNLAADSHSGLNVNVIAIEVPISMLSKTGTVQPSTSPEATIGAWATLSKPRTTELRKHEAPSVSSDYVQIDRMGNPFIRDLVIPLGDRSNWSEDDPSDDNAYEASYLNPGMAAVINAIYGLPVPTSPRVDLLPLMVYAPPIAASGTSPGPVADMLRLNTGVPPSVIARSRLGLTVGDPAGYPNGRRVFDDVLDITLRLLAGALAGSQYNYDLGDGVNVNDIPYQETFPYVAWAQNGRSRRHIDPGEQGCTQNTGSPCALN
jgi:hypothetical protein